MSKIDVGDEVLIFSRVDYKYETVLPLYIKGKVVERNRSDDLSYHGSPWYVDLYKVLGEDGCYYTGTYDHPIIGSVYFYTREDYIKHLEYVIEKNKDKISELKKLNKEIDERIEEINDLDFKLIKK